MHSINVIKGNLLKRADSGFYEAICHGANCFCTMGAGIAAGVRIMFPAAYMADCKTIPGDIHKLGDYTVAQIKNKKQEFFLFNIYSQYTYNAAQKPLDYEALTLGLRKMAFACKNKISKIGLPLIGFGLAGGNLEKIIPIIYRELYDFDVEIVVFEDDIDADDSLHRVQEIINNLDSLKS